MNPDALDHLRRADPVMKALIARVGPCTLKPRQRRSPFESLVRAVANQQLSNRAAATILARFRAMFPRGAFPGPAALQAITDEQLRACGFSRAKIASLREIASKAISGEIPSLRQIRSMTDEEIIERLDAVRGVGRWTVEMLLIFGLGRPDVLPVDDFGVRNGFRLAYGLAEMPKPSAVLQHGERWRPFRSTASWYLWRAVEVYGRAPA